MPRNEPWTPDELILALDVYFRVPPQHASKAHPEIVSLSKVLNLMAGRAKAKDQATYRNPNSVYMKLRSFIRFDQNTSAVGLRRGGKLEGAIWRGFVEDRALLRRTAREIRERAVGKRQLEAL